MGCAKGLAKRQIGLQSRDGRPRQGTPRPVLVREAEGGVQRAGQGTASRSLPSVLAASGP